MWAYRTILCFVLFWGGCIASVINPIWGVITYMVVYMLFPSNTWWGRPLADQGIRFSLYAFMFLFLGLVFSSKRVPKNRPRLTAWEIGVVALVLIAIVNVFAGTGYNIWARMAFEKFWKMCVFLLVLTQLTSNRRNLRMVLWTLVGGSLYLGYDAWNAPDWAFQHGRLEFVGGPDFSTTSGLGAHMAAMLPLIGAAFLIARNWKYRLVATAAGILTVNTIVLCRTRSVFIGMAAGAIVAILCAPRAKRFRIHLLLIIAAFGSYTLTDAKFWHRMATLTDPSIVAEERSTADRVGLIQAGSRILADHPLGIGVGNFLNVIRVYESQSDLYNRTSHNTLLVAFVELGYQGGLIFVAIIAGSFWYLYRSARLAPKCAEPVETQMLIYGVLISLVTYLVTGLSTERFYCESFWWILAWPLCLHRTVAREVVWCQASEAIECIPIDPELSFPANYGSELDDAPSSHPAFG